MRLRLGVRGKLFVVTLGLMLVGGAASAAFLDYKLHSWLEARIEAELFRHAAVVRSTLEVARGPVTIEAIDNLADRLGAATKTRVTVINAAGTVLGDSDLTLEQVRRVENHGRRPEVVRAMKIGKATARRHSATTKKDLLYVAMRYNRDGQRGIARLAIALHAVGPVVAWLRVLLIASALIGVGVAALITGLSSHLLTRTLRNMVDKARKLVRNDDGDEQVEAHPIMTASDEIGFLAGSFNHLASELQDNVEALAKERDRLGTVLEGMSEALITLDASQRIALANPAALRLLEEDQPVTGKLLREVVPDVPQLHELAAEGISRPAAAELTLPRKMRAATPRRVETRVAPLRATGGCVLVMLDVTEVRRLETIRQDFVANVSHELRTPVSVIQANAETLLSGALGDPKQARHFVEALNRNALRLSRIIADLLDLARIEAGRYKLSPTSIRVAEAATNVKDSLEQSAAEKQISISVEVDEVLFVSADAKALDQVLVNLLDNAVKYTPRGGHIVVGARQQGANVRIEVRDDGPGIPEPLRGRIFERFFRVDPGRSRDAGGTGLGLAIVKHLVTSMEGKIGVDPADPHGSIFWLTLAAPTKSTASNF